MTKNKLAEVISLRAGLKETVNTVFESLPTEYTSYEAAESLSQAIIRDVDLNDYALDIARSIIDSEETVRAIKTPAEDGGQLNLSMVEDSVFAKGRIIKLGKSKRVQADASKLQHGIVHGGKLNTNAVTATQAAQRWNTLMEKCVPYIEKNTKLTLKEAWKMFITDNPQ